MSKTTSYVMVGAGILVILLSFAQVRNALKIPIPAIKNLDLILMIAGGVLAVVGVFLLSKSSGGGQPKEVPIYEGHGKERKVVGIQRMGKS